MKRTGSSRTFVKLIVASQVPRFFRANIIPRLVIFIYKLSLGAFKAIPKNIT